MAINKNFVVKNGLEVNTNLIIANALTNSVGIGTSVADYKLDVNGGIGATDLYVSGFGTVSNISGDTLNYSSGTFDSVVSGIATLGTTGISTLNVTGVSTLGTVEINSGVISAASGIVTYYGDGQYLDLSGNVSGGIGIGTSLGPIGYGVTFLVFGSGISSSTYDTSSGISTIYLAAGDTPNNGLLTLNTSGTGISGSASFTANQSGNSTFTVTSNATSANTSSTIVARDGSGNFSAGTITANLTGTATTATNLASAANITTGTINVSRLTGLYNIDISGNAATATNASNLTNAANITTGTINAARLSGSYNIDISGTATNANNINISATTSTDTTTSVVLVGSQSTGNQSPFIDSGLSYNANSNALTATTFVGALTGTADIASSINVSDESSDTTCFPVFTIGSVGTFAPKTDSSSLTYDASTGTLAATNLNSTSDITLKKDIEAIKDSREILNQIRGVRFSWKETNQKSLGVIAQEIEKVLPELISERSDNGVKSVNYNGLVGVLIEAVKELSNEVEELKKKIS